MKYSFFRYLFRRITTSKPNLSPEEIQNRLEYLAKMEFEIIHKISIKYNSTKEEDAAWEEIFMNYHHIYEEYASLSSVNSEALKRAVFIQWYQLSEPNFNTGIPELDMVTEKLVLDNLNTLFKNKNQDDEIIWMLNYYNMWDYIFARVPGFKGFDRTIINEKKSELYKIQKVNIEEMSKRGALGDYWAPVFQKTSAKS